MVETMANDNWQQFYVHSPTGSVDSGVELSPTRTSLPYGVYDEYCSQICGDGTGPGSPAYSSGSSQVGEGNLGCPATFPDQLTQEELDALSDTLSEAFSPCPEDEQTPVTDLTEIGQYEYPQQRPAENLGELLIDSQEPSSNTLKKRRSRQKVRVDAFGDSCLIPKSGTSKPRQSRRKRKGAKQDPMAGGKVMNMKKHYSGARVKVTARERLEELRRVQKSQGAMESSSRVGAQSTVQGVSHQPPVKRQALDGVGATYGAPYSMTQSQVAAAPTTRPHIGHSVRQILSPSHHGFHGDSLDSILVEAVEHGNTHPLELYAQQMNAHCTGNGQTVFLHILKRLVESKDRFPAQDIKTVTIRLCKIFPETIDAQNYQGETPIFQAALYGCVGAVQALMEEGANPWKQENSAGETALHAAVRSKKYSVVDAILVGVKNPGHYQYMRQIPGNGVNIRSLDGHTPLHKAAALRDVDMETQKKIVFALLESGADPSIKNTQSQMAHYFLPKALEELQTHMKRMNGRKNRLAHHSAPIQNESPPPYCRAPSFQPQYHSHFTPEMVQAHLAHPSFAQRQQFHYGGLPQGVPSFSTSPQSTFTQFEPTAHPQTAAPYLIEHRITTPGVITTHSTPQSQEDVINDILGIESSFS